jgi:hypothetical protein
VGLVCSMVGVVVDVQVVAGGRLAIWLEARLGNRGTKGRTRGLSSFGAAPNTGVWLIQMYRRCCLDITVTCLA